MPMMLLNVWRLEIVECVYETCSENCLENVFSIHVVVGDTEHYKVKLVCCQDTVSLGRLTMMWFFLYRSQGLLHVSVLPGA
jgi:hypothetical protein